MKPGDIAFIFNRAITHSFGKIKLMIIFLTLAISGLFIVFCRGLAVQTGEWITLSMTFLPIFYTLGILMSVGILIIRAYHDELKKESVEFRKILKKSWEVILGASYFAIPIILSYLILWLMLGIFLLLESIPGLGDFFGVVLAFVPFLLNLGSIVLCILSFAALFFLTPVMALKGFNRLMISQYLTSRFQKDPFSNLILFLVSILPFAFVLLMLLIALYLTDSLYDVVKSPLYTTLQWFFIMLPFTAILAPSVIFFFNFATESHVLLQKSSKGNKGDQI